MRSRLTPDTLLLAGVLLLTLGIAIYAVGSGRAQQDESLQRRTTYSSRPGGYQALFEAMQQLHLPVGRWRHPLNALGAPGTILVAEPESPPSAGEWEGLARWVARGNLLIYLSDHGLQWEDWVESSDQPEPPEQADHPVQPAPPAAVAPALRTRTAYHLDAGEWEAGPRSTEREFRRQPVPDLLAESSVPLYQDDQGPTVTFARWGRGIVIQCSSPWSLGTTGVRAGDNFRWLLAMVEAYGPRSGVQAFRRSGVQDRPDPSHPSDPFDPERLNAQDHRFAAVPPERLNAIWFDEYHHGYQEERGVLSLLAPIARLGLAQLGIAWLLLLFTVSRRFGGRIPDEGRVRRSRSEYLGSMASLLRRARAADLAVDQMRRQFLHEATHALGLPRDPELGALLAAAGTRGIDPENLRALLDRAASLAADRDRARQEDILAVARELASLRRQLARHG